MNNKVSNKRVKLIGITIFFILIVIIPVIEYFLFYKIDNIHASKDTIRYFNFLGMYLSSIIGLSGVVLTIFYSFKNTEIQLDKSRENSFNNTVYLYLYKETDKALIKLGYILNDLLHICAESLSIAENIKLNKFPKYKSNNIRQVNQLEHKLNNMIPNMNKYFNVCSYTFGNRNVTLKMLNIKNIEFHGEKLNFLNVMNLYAKASFYSDTLWNDLGGLIHEENDIKWLKQIHKDSRHIIEIIRKINIELGLFQNVYVINNDLNEEKHNK